MTQLAFSRRRLLQVGLAAAIAPASAGHAADALLGGGRDITLEDLLRRRQMGDIWFSPDGRHLSYGLVHSLTEQRSSEYTDEILNGQDARVIDVETGTARSLRLDGHGVGHLRMMDASPWRADGNALAVLLTRDGWYGYGYWRPDDQLLRPLPGRPLSPNNPQLAWAGAYLVYSSMPDSLPQGWSRRQQVEFAASDWARSWQENVPTTIVSSTSKGVEESDFGQGALYAVDCDTGRQLVLQKGNFSRIWGSPDGRYVAAVRLHEAYSQALGESGHRAELVVFDVTAFPRLVHTVSGLDVHPGQGAWSRDGRLLFGAKEVEAERGQVDLYVLDLAQSKLKRLSPAGISIARPKRGILPELLPLGWAGRTPLAVAARRSDKNSEAVGAVDPTGVLEKLRLDLYAFGRSLPRNLTKDFEDTSAFARERRFVADAFGGALFILEGAVWRAVGRGRLRRVAAPAAGRAEFFSIAGRARGFYWMPVYASCDGSEQVLVQARRLDGALLSVILDLTTGVETPVVTELAAISPSLKRRIVSTQTGWTEDYLLEGERRAPVASLNEHFADVRFNPPQTFSYQVGTQSLTGWFVAPLSPTTTPPPAVLWVYGGEVQGGTAPWEARPDGGAPFLHGQLLAAQGYTVVYPSLPVRAGLVSSLPEDLAEAAVAAVDAAARLRILDPARVAVAGHSFGGFTTAAILTKRSDRFRCGIASAGIYNAISVWGAASMSEFLFPNDWNMALAIADRSQLGLSEPPWKAASAYLENSPMMQVEHINSPLLIFQGDLDNAVTSAYGAQQMYMALLKAGKEAALVRYRGEGHSYMTAAAERDRVTRSLDWLRKHLAHH